ncbi:hypothetical protein NC651_020727 [Populus alba x Populus x berolinensis]|nr:hypothetical protein NC651_020727 [Populus alba x Populus x berolinensis]
MANTNRFFSFSYRILCFHKTTISNDDDCVEVTEHFSMENEEEETTRHQWGIVAFDSEEELEGEELAVEDDDLVGKALQKCAKISAELKRDLYGTGLTSCDRYAEVEISSVRIVTQPVHCCRRFRFPAFLKPYQLGGVKFLFLLYRKGIEGAILADEMGLGKTIQWSCVAMDEAHASKDKNSYRWKNLVSVARNANQRLMLTGTPLQNDFITWLTLSIRTLRKHACCPTRAGGQGLNLTGADTVIIPDLDFNPQIDRQVEDHCHRIGHTKPVTMYRMVTKGTVDETVNEMAKWKLVLDAAVLDSVVGVDKSSRTTGEILSSLAMV